MDHRIGSHECNHQSDQGSYHCPDQCIQISSVYTVPCKHLPISIQGYSFRPEFKSRLICKHLVRKRKNQRMPNRIKEHKGKKCHNKISKNLRLFSSFSGCFSHHNPSSPSLSFSTILLEITTKINPTRF